MTICMYAVNELRVPPVPMLRGVGLRGDIVVPDLRDRARPALGAARNPPAGAVAVAIFTDGSYYNASKPETAAWAITCVSEDGGRYHFDGFTGGRVASSIRSQCDIGAVSNVVAETAAMLWSLLCSAQCSLGVGQSR